MNEDNLSWTRNGLESCAPLLARIFSVAKAASDRAVHGEKLSERKRLEPSKTLKVLCGKALCPDPSSSSISVTAVFLGKCSICAGCARSLLRIQAQFRSLLVDDDLTCMLQWSSWHSYAYRIWEKVQAIASELLSTVQKDSFHQAIVNKEGKL